MHEIEIRLRTVQDVLDFVALATERSFPICVGSDRHQVNGISFMEMCCLDLCEPLTATLCCGEQEYADFCREAARFLAK